MGEDVRPGGRLSGDTSEQEIWGALGNPKCAMQAEKTCSPSSCVAQNQASGKPAQTLSLL